MVQAAVAGAIDFSTAELLDRRWWFKLRFILDRVEDEHAIDFFKLQHAQHAAVVDYKLSKEAFDTHWDGGNKLIQQIHALYFPWEKQARDKSSDNSRADLLESWRKRFGDLNDPAVRNKFDRIAKAMREHNKKKSAKMATTGNSTHEKLRKLMAGRRKYARK